MAFSPTNTRVRFYVEDNTAKERAWPVTLNPSHEDCTSLAVIASTPGIANLTSIASTMGAVTQGKITRFEVVQTYVSDASGTGAGDHDDKAIVSINLETLGKRANLYIPAPASTIFVGDGAYGPESETVDPADSALLAYLALYKATGGTLLLSDGEKASDTLGPKGHKI